MVKIPRLTNLQTICNGMLGNMQEITFGSVKNKETYSKRLMPVLRGSCPFWVIMPRGLEVRFFRVIDLWMYDKDGVCKDESGNILPVERKASSWARYKGRYVAIDYGS